MKNDLEILNLNAFDKKFLADLKITIPTDTETRWDIDGDAPESSHPEAAE